MRKPEQNPDGETTNVTRGGEEPITPLVSFMIRDTDNGIGYDSKRDALDKMGVIRRFCSHPTKEKEMRGWKRGVRPEKTDANRIHHRYTVFGELSSNPEFKLSISIRPLHHCHGDRVKKSGRVVDSLSLERENQNLAAVVVLIGTKPREGFPRLSFFKSWCFPCRIGGVVCD